MLDRFARLLDVSPTIAGIVLVLLAVQVATQAYALIDLARRDLVRGGRKWVWALVIALGSILGAIGYLVAGRPALQVDVAGHSGASAAGADAARRAVDTLYGPRDGQ